MKSIKYILSIPMLLGAIVSNAQTYDWYYYNPNTGYSQTISSSYTPATVYTPNNTQVSVEQWVSGDWYQITKEDMIDYYQSQYGGRLTFESEATANIIAMHGHGQEVLHIGCSRLKKKNIFLLPT